MHLYLEPSERISDVVVQRVGTVVVVAEGQ